ncbi:MAG: GtrA family protein [Rudaea sp.]
MTAFFEWVNSLAPAPIRQAHPEVRRFIKFAIVGAFGAAVDFSVLSLLYLGFHVDKYIANIFSVTAAIISNFIWNRLWTFPESQVHGAFSQFFQFALVNVLGLVINEAVFVAVDQYIFEPTVGHYGFLLAKACAIGVVLFWNFGANRVTTYRHIK